MKQYFLPLTLFFLLAVCASTTYAQKNHSAKLDPKEKIEIERKLFFEQKACITKEQSPDFWLIYNEYKKRDAELHKQEIDLRKKNIEKKITDKEYGDIMKNLLAIEAERLKLKTNFYERMNGLLTPKQQFLLYDAAKQYRSILLKKVNNHHDK
ncbi:MAG: hypothetical protein LBS50_07000 [Prevotellaceae bacterium]|jgi:hypothetical protein|nr:hypothetical protein [Prevotellaceae bacterium]